jgi:probable biosynthetic protein (TIGR04098 family)
MKTRSQFMAGLPQLDVHTLSEDWALMTGLENHWRLLAESLGLRPSRWIDTQGDRMYGAVIALSTRFDLDDVVLEDDEIIAETTISSIRKPHALSRTEFFVDGKAKAHVDLLTSFIKRQQKGSNKKFSKVRDLWTAENMNIGPIDDLLDRHHRLKSHHDDGNIVQETEVNRIQDFNTADFMYFKNFVRFAKAAEWKENRGASPRLNEARECYFYGNADDGQLLHTKVGRSGDRFQTSHHLDDGRRIFLSLGTSRIVKISER